MIFRGGEAFKTQSKCTKQREMVVMRPSHTGQKSALIAFGHKDTP